jgi:hypothetical protein
VTINRVNGIKFENISKACTCDSRLVNVHRLKQLGTKSVTVFLNSNGPDVLIKGRNEGPFDSHLLSFEFIVYH